MSFKKKEKRRKKEKFAYICIQPQAKFFALASGCKGMAYNFNGSVRGLSGRYVRDTEFD